MAGVQLSGLSSGLDTEGIISGLMAVEQAPRQQLVLRQAAAQARKDKLTAIEDKLNTLKLASTDLSSTLTWLPAQTVDTTDATKASARITGGAGPGGYNLVVTQLASADQRTYAYTQNAADQTVSLNGKNLTITANSSIDTVVSQINNDPTYGVFAVNANGKLVLASRTTGSAGNINFTDGTGTLVEDPTVRKPGQDANYTLDGKSYTSSSNVISATSTTNPAGGVLAGVELTLKGLTDATGITVNVSPPAVDKSVVTNKVKAFIDAYNGAMDLMRSTVSEQKVANASTTTDVAKGVLFGDSGINSLMDQLRNSVGQTVAGMGNTAMDQLSEIGISTGAASGSSTFSQDAVNGKLVLDSTALSNALDSNPLGVQKLLGGMTGVNGFAQSFNTTLTPYTQTSGVFDSREDSAAADIKMYTDSMASMDLRLQQKETALRTMFTNMELALQKAKAQGTDMLSRLGISSNDS